MIEQTFQNWDWKFKTGLILIFCCSIIIGLFHVGVLYLCGIPIFGLLLGIIFIWSANETLKTKIILTFIPIPTIFATFFWMYQLKKAEPEIYLIPQNYRGAFLIKFDESCGESITYEKGRRIYRIPDNGFLILKGKQTFGFTDRKLFLIDDDGNLTNLPEFYWSKFEDEEKQFNSIFSKTTLTKDLVGVFYHLSNIDYQRFTVSNYQALENETKESAEMKDKLFQNKVDNLLKKCRQ
jgi:hypothetical protein